MKRINNKNGIEMYWEKAKGINKINILDSNGNYFKDVYFDNGQKGIDEILYHLERMTSETMCKFFGVIKYNSFREIAENRQITIKHLKDNKHLNIFDVNGQLLYAWTW